MLFFIRFGSDPWLEVWYHPNVWSSNLTVPVCGHHLWALPWLSQKPGLQYCICFDAKAISLIMLCISTKIANWDVLRTPEPHLVLTVLGCSVQAQHTTAASVFLANGSGPYQISGLHQQAYGTGIKLATRADLCIYFFPPPHRHVTLF